MYGEAKLSSGSGQGGASLELVATSQCGGRGEDNKQVAVAVFVDTRAQATSEV